jgi:hypothetical protein
MMFGVGASRRVLISLPLLALTLALGACAAPAGEGPSQVAATPTATVGATTTPSPTLTSQVVTFPFSWEDGGIEITVAEIRNVGATIEGEGYTIEADVGYEFVGVRIIYRDLVREEELTYGIGEPSLALKTHQGNTYKPYELLGFWHIPGSALEEVEETWAHFEIPQDETPVELWHYKVTVPEGDVSQQTIVHLWKLE